MKRLLVCLAVVVAAVEVGAVVPSTELYLPSVGRGQGSCPGGVCSQWRTDVWILNPASSGRVSVEIAFLRRNADNADPVTGTVQLEPGETLELVDVMQSLFQLDGAFGALRFVADGEIVVTGRIYDGNVRTNLGAGTAGQFFGALPAEAALAVGESTQLIGLALDSAAVWRTNFGFVEVSGHAATVTADLCDENGVVLASKSYPLAAYGVGQVSIADVGGPPGENLRLAARVASGSGRVLVFGSRIDNRTGDPSTVEMVTSAGGHSTGQFIGVVMTPDGLRPDGGIEVSMTSAGATAFSGVAGIPCGDDVFSVDFGTAPTAPAALSATGSFQLSVTTPYNDNGVTVFNVVWTLAGTLDRRGTLAGTLTSATSNGLGAWSACDGTVTRAWRAGWAGDAGS